MIIGNEEKQNELLTIVKKDKIVNSYIFTGKEGIGKFQIAKKFAKQILCNKQCQEHCICTSCVKFETNNHPDYFEINTEDTIKINQIRDFQENVYIRPLIAKKKVLIINNAENLTKEAQNCLLKTLEEPPNFLVMILVTNDENNLLETIRSRCILNRFNPLTQKQLEKYIEENKEILCSLNQEQIDLSTLKLEYIDGSIKSLHEYIENYELYQNIINFVEILSQTSKLSFSKYMELTKLIYNEEKIFEILKLLSTSFFEKTKETKNQAIQQKCINSVFLIEDVKQRLKNNSNFNMCIDRLLFNLWEEFN